VVFNSLTFLVFFVVLLVLHHLPFLSWRAKKVNLLIASYVFYAAWNPPFILLLWASTIVDWFIARGIYGARDKSRAVRRSWLVISVAVNIGFIGFSNGALFILPAGFQPSNRAPFPRFSAGRVIPYRRSRAAVPSCRRLV